MRKKIYIYAFASLNLGDDLFVKILCERYPKTDFYIQSSNKMSIAFNKIENLKVIPTIRYIDGLFQRIGFNINFNSFLARSFSRFCDGVIYIGGSIFIQSKEWKNKIKLFEKSIIPMKPFYVIGSNFGPYWKEEYLDKFKKLFYKATDVCFRDEYSYNLFSDLDNIRKASDIVFALDSPSISTDFTSDKSTFPDRRSIVISVIQLADREGLKQYKESYDKHIYKLSNKFIDMGYHVNLMGFCKSQGDGIAIDEIMQMFDKEKRSFVSSNSYDGNLKNSLNIIRNSNYVLGSRFHSMILGWVFKKPFYPIIYSDKSINVINDMGFNGIYTNIKNLKNVNVDKIVSRLTSQESIDIDCQVSSAINQFIRIDEFLKGTNGDVNEKY